MKFIRKNGRIIPIKDTMGVKTTQVGPGESNIDAAKRVAKAASPKPGKNTVGQRFKTGYAIGAMGGSLVGMMHGNMLKGAAIGGAIGGAGRAAIGPRNTKEPKLGGVAKLYVGMGAVGSALIARRGYKSYQALDALAAAHGTTGKEALKAIAKGNISGLKAGIGFIKGDLQRRFRRTKISGKSGNVIFGKFPGKA